MAIALFHEPVAAFREGYNGRGSGPVLVLGIEQGDLYAGGIPTGQAYCSALYADDEGKLAVCGIGELTIDYRYDWRTHTWVDVGGFDDSQEDDAADGGTEVSGRVPVADDLGAGDPVDPEGRQTTGDLGDLDPGEAG